MSTHVLPVLFRFLLQCIVSNSHPRFSFFDLTSADADIVCARAKNHYDPGGSLDLSESATQTVDSDRADVTLEAFKTGFKQVHQYHRMRMYFSVG